MARRDGMSTRRGLAGLSVMFLLVAATLLVTATSAVRLTAQQRGAPRGDVQDWFLQWPLPAGAERYGDIDGRRMHRDVVAQAEIARRYRDQGHPKFWGAHHRQLRGCRECRVAGRSVPGDRSC